MTGSYLPQSLYRSATSSGFGRGFLFVQTPIRNLGRRPVSKSGKLFEGECIKWTRTYLYLTMIALLVPLRG